jgi:hypothetical protein
MRAIALRHLPIFLTPPLFAGCQLPSLRPRALAGNLRPNVESAGRLMTAVRIYSPHPTPFTGRARERLVVVGSARTLGSSARWASLYAAARPAEGVVDFLPA